MRPDSPIATRFCAFDPWSPPRGRSEGTTFNFFLFGVFKITPPVFTLVHCRGGPSHPPEGPSLAVSPQGLVLPRARAGVAVSRAPQGSYTPRCPGVVHIVLASPNGLSVEIKANLYENIVFLLSLHVDSGLESGACAPGPCRGGALGSARPSAAGPRGRRGEEGGLQPGRVAVCVQLSSVE